MSQPPRGRSRGWGRPGESRPPQPSVHRGQPQVHDAARRPGAWSQPGGSGDAQQAGPSSAQSVDVTAGGMKSSGDTAPLGRGSTRGRRTVQTSSELLLTRPTHIQSKKGSSGHPINLQANYFKLLSAPDWCLYQYRVDFSPSEDLTIKRKGLLRNHKEKLGMYIFDGTVLFTAHRLPEKMELFSKRSSDDENIRIDIKFVGDVARGDYHYLQVFNIITRKCLSFLKLQLVGRNYFDPQQSIEVAQYHLELWPGYITSIRQHEKDLLMCAEITHKVMRQQTLLDILDDCYRDRSSDFQRTFKSRVIGIVVLTDYNNNTYRVDDVDFNVTPNSTFKLRDGNDITYKEYYLKKYAIRIRNESQPLLLTRNKPRERRAEEVQFVYLVPELCRSTGLTDDMRSNTHLMRELDKHTRVSPQIRIQKLLALNQRLQREKLVMDEFKSWDLKFDRNLINIPARVMPQEMILFKNLRADGGAQADWTMQFRKAHLLNPKELKRWVVFHTRRAGNEIERFIQMIQKVSTTMNFRIAQPRYMCIQDDRSSTYTMELEQMLSKHNPELVFCVVSNNRSDRYSCIKKKCCVDRPVPSQVLLERNLSSKGVMSIATKVAVQMCCKLGGSPWCVEIPLDLCMVIGFDVCHDTEQRNKDFSAMVASLDRNCTRYYSAVSSHDVGQELSNDLSVNVVKAVQKYKQQNGNFPLKIIIYRDGVGEGQVPYVVEHEVGAIRKKLDVLYGDPSAVHMAFIIVSKRVNTRFFTEGRNPPPGTVVDDVVTNPLKYDFFIVSQHVREGTVSPTSYSVIYDTSGLDPDKMQRLTYKMTHLYYNWSGTVRVPAPCQYAHKLAFFVSQFVHTAPSNQLENLLYFL